MFDKPITFKEADQALAKRKDKTTYLKSREIALAWNADARSRAFFSARVANATILSELHNKVDAVVKGQMTKAQAHNLIRRYFAGEGADALAELGFAPPKEAKSIAQLSSVSRVQLILDTNVNMAQEVGQYKQWAAQRDIYKYGIWKVGYSKEHRPEHLARDGKAYAFDHPIWTQSPPGGEFNCHCYRMLVREEDVFERGITPERPDIPFEPSSLGFNPARGLRKPPEFGKRVKKEYKDKAKEQMAQFKPEEEIIPAVTELTPEEHAAKRQEQWTRAYEKRNSAFEQKIITDAEKNFAFIEPLFLPNEQRIYTEAEKDEAKNTAKAKIRELAAEFKACYTPSIVRLGKPPKITLNYKETDSSHYKVGMNEINIRLRDPETGRFDDWHSALSCARHEFGHWVHEKQEIKGSKSLIEKIRNAGNNDWSNVQKMISEKKSPFHNISGKNGLIEFVTGKKEYSELTIEENHLVCAFLDGVGSISSGQAGGGHPIAYYRMQNRHTVFGEAVANLFAMASVLPEEKIKLAFPELSAIVLSWR